MKKQQNKHQTKINNIKQFPNLWNGNRNKIQLSVTTYDEDRYERHKAMQSKRPKINYARNNWWTCFGFDQIYCVWSCATEKVG